MTIEFSDVLAAIQPRDAATLEVTIPPEWLQGRTVFGGLQMAITGTSRTSHFVHELSPPHVPAAGDVPDQPWNQTPVFLQHFDMRVARGDLPFTGYAEPRSSIFVRLRDPAQLDHHDWALLDTEVRAGTDGYLSQTSVLYGADGHAYSVSHQTVAVFG
jgi:hypothetical protein